MNKLLIVIIIILLYTTIFRINITVNQPIKVESQDELAYWTEDVNPHDGECHCPGGAMCTTCPMQPDKPCGCTITRLDLLDAKQRYQTVLKEFDNIIH